MLDEFDPGKIQDENVRQSFIKLLNLVETLLLQTQQQKEIIQQLRDEINRLKGEQAQPKFKPAKTNSKISSEQQRRKPKEHRKTSKQNKIVIEREEICRLEPSSLPKDATFKGYEAVVVQEVVFQTANVRFKREKYYSASQNQIYLAPLPKGYDGQFGPGVKGWVLSLYFSGGMSEPKILEVLQQAGLLISAGQISNLLITNQQLFEAESQAVYEAGLSSSPWQHIDDTTTSVDGVNQYCHIVANPLYTAYHTLPHKDRLSILKVLSPQHSLKFRLNELAWSYLNEMNLGRKWQLQLAQLPYECDLDEAELDKLLKTYLPTLGPQQVKWVKEALAVAAYQQRVDFPVVALLLCDDAPQFHLLTEELALCWIHEGRHYKKLTPVLPYHRQLLSAFEAEFWEFYRQLLLYQVEPNPLEAERLRVEFNKLFSHISGYEALDKRIGQTLLKGENLLMVLSHPEIPLHNNPAELGARQRVRKRDVSFGPRSEAGVRAWDTFQTLVETARKLGVNFYRYIHDRISQTNELESLASLIKLRAKQMNLGASWGKA